MSPCLSPESYVYVTSNAPLRKLAALNPWALISEDEGLTLILSKDQADKHRLFYDSSFKRITLMVHSSLAAVGLTAAVSTALAKLRISANVVAACYHDHIFVPEDRAEEALQALQDLSVEGK